MEFQVGDIVEAFGNRGRVVAIDRRSSHPVLVQYDWIPINETFTLDGRVSTHHKTVSLNLISRPRKTKKIMIWVNVTKFEHGTMNITQYVSEETAKKCASRHSVTQQIEVEVSE